MDVRWWIKGYCCSLFKGWDIGIDQTEMKMTTCVRRYCLFNFLHYVPSLSNSGL